MAKKAKKRSQANFNTLYVVGSNSLKNKLTVEMSKFQYIICCWFNNGEITEIREFIQFQYIICCWFNHCVGMCFIYSMISIHYMLLVQVRTFI